MSNIHPPLTLDNWEMAPMDRAMKNEQCKVMLTHIQRLKPFRKQCQKITMCHFMIVDRKWKWLDGQCSVREWLYIFITMREPDALLRH